MSTETRDLIHITVPTRLLPELACANCYVRDDVRPVTYRDGDVITAIVLLCNLCRRALKNGEIAANLLIWVEGREHFT